MIVTCVYIHVKPGSVDRFIEATTANHLESVKEPGNLRFDLIQEIADACRFMIYEAYESEAAASDHKNTSHYMEWRNAVQDLLVEPKRGVKYNIIEPEDKTRW